MAAKRRYDLADRDDVRDFFVSRVRATCGRAQTQSDGVQIARIEEVPYRGIGYVFEPHLGQMHPTLVGEGEREPTHLAYFGANLTP